MEKTNAFLVEDPNGESVKKWASEFRRVGKKVGVFYAVACGFNDGRPAQPQRLAVSNLNRTVKEIEKAFLEADKQAAQLIVNEEAAKMLEETGYGDLLKGKLVTVIATGEGTPYALVVPNLIYNEVRVSKRKTVHPLVTTRDVMSPNSGVGVCFYLPINADELDYVELYAGYLASVKFFTLIDEGTAKALEFAEAVRFWDSIVERETQQVYREARREAIAAGGVVPTDMSEFRGEGKKRTVQLLGKRPEEVLEGSDDVQEAVEPVTAVEVWPLTELPPMSSISYRERALIKDSPDLLAALNELRAPEVNGPVTAVEVLAAVGVHVVAESETDWDEVEAIEGQVFTFPQPVDNVVEEPAGVAETCLIPGESFADSVSNTIKYRAITVPAMPDRAPSVHLEPTWTRDSICVADSKKVSRDWNGHPMDHKTTHYNQAARDLGWSEVGTVLEVVGVDGPAMFLCERGEVQAVFDLLEDPESAPEDLEDSESTASHSLPFEPLRVAEKALTVTKKQAKKLTNKLQHNGWLLVDVEYVDDESGDVEWMMFNKRGEWVRVHLEGWLVLGGDLATPYGNAPHWFLRDEAEMDHIVSTVLKAS